MPKRSNFLAGLPLLGLVFGAGDALGASGSLLIFPNIEIAWDSTGAVTRDTLINLSNGYQHEVRVQLFLVNGDPPLDPVQGERGHPGCNRYGCTISLDYFEATYWSARTGLPGGCPFTVLDFGNPPGRPDPEHPGGRVLRGFLYAWAIDPDGREINWNYLRGDATVFDFIDDGAWGYEATAFRALTGTRGQLLPDSGTLNLDGIEYEQAFARLLMNFSAVGNVPLFGDGRLFQVDTDLTLLPVSRDFRQDNDGPPTTKAHFDIVNMDGDGRSGTTRCITCWDQTLLSAYDGPNHFLFENLHTEVGSAIIDGMASTVCPDSTIEALLGVAVRIISFPGLTGAADWTGDGVMDLDDHAAFATCITGSGPDDPQADFACRSTFDLDGDGDVDMRDFGLLPFAIDVDRSYSAVNLVGEGGQSAVIRYDVPD